MSNLKTLATSLMSLSTGVLLALSAAGGASASPAESHTQPLASGHLQVTETVLSNSAAAGYWTPDRMRAAIPGDVLAEKAVARQKANGTSSASRQPAVQKGTTTKVPGKSAIGTTGLHSDEDPISHIGKVFFTIGGANYVCSGNSVGAPNNSTVATAGHCLNEGAGAFASNFIFVPGYDNGSAPYGKWVAKALFAPTQWSSSANMTYDTGFAVMAPLNGRKLADVVGASAVLFNAERSLDYTAYGYPAGPPFDGQTLKSCTGVAVDDRTNPQFKTQGISCDMNGGSSGGPWLTGEDSVQNSVNSYGYGSRATMIYGPYWGSVIQKTYASASLK